MTAQGNPVQMISRRVPRAPGRPSRWIQIAGIALAGCAGAGPDAGLKAGGAERPWIVEAPAGGGVDQFAERRGLHFPAIMDTSVCT